KGGTRFSMLALQMTFVPPASISTDPSGCLIYPVVIVTFRICCFSIIPTPFFLYHCFFHRHFLYMNNFFIENFFCYFPKHVYITSCIKVMFPFSWLGTKSIEEFQ